MSILGPSISRLVIIYDQLQELNINSTFIKTISGLTNNCVLFVGLTKYSEEATTEWNLNTHRTKESPLKAIKKIQQNGEGTNTG